MVEAKEKPASETATTNTTTPAMPTTTEMASGLLVDPSTQAVVAGTRETFILKAIEILSTNGSTFLFYPHFFS